MNRRTLPLTLVLAFVAVTVGWAADPFMGTWKLNEAKSKIGPGAPKNATIVYEAAGDSTKVTVDGVDGAGKPSHSVWTGKFDGKDYSVTGDATADMRAYARVDERTMTFTQKKDGKVTMSGRIAVAADGKSRTVTTTITDAQGKKTDSTAVYDKQ
jgi:hypothetical protein